MKNKTNRGIIRRGLSAIAPTLIFGPLMAGYAILPREIEANAIDEFFVDNIGLSSNENEWNAYQSEQEKLWESVWEYEANKPEGKENLETILEDVEPADSEKEDKIIPAYSEEESDELTLARLIYAEARSEWENPEILYHKGSSVLNRAKGSSVKKAIFEDAQYKSIRDGNSKYFLNPEKSVEESRINEEAWKVCYNVAEELIEEGPKYDTFFTIHQKANEKAPEKMYGWVRDGLKNGEMKEITVLASTSGKYHFYKKN
ncbi:hypothetical protein COU53_02050 [Candidatus Pacearchaeota archaeon CG10_big_fil_rev_8_21_14_0_10_30_48]|nr:MAG: hypothetical protein COU53_02050 [Candidatus Pacearchaeota archaeon CG10_big_fil_rev_8_21_14_0_10_30_48]